MDNMTPIQEAALHVLGYYGIKGGVKANKFTNLLIEAISHADTRNFIKLSREYPELAEAVSVYKDEENGLELLYLNAELAIPEPEPTVEEVAQFMLDALKEQEGVGVSRVELIILTTLQAPNASPDSLFLAFATLLIRNEISINPDPLSGEDKITLF